MDDNSKARLAVVGAAILFFIESGLQVSGFTNLPLAIVLWGLAATLAAYWVYHTVNALLIGRGRAPLRLGRNIYVATALLVMSGSLVGALVYLFHASSKQHERFILPPNASPLLKSMAADFPEMDAQTWDWGVNFSPTIQNKVPVIIHFDLRTMTKFLSLYVPDSNVFETSKRLGGNLNTILDSMPNIIVNGNPEHWNFIVKRWYDGDANPLTSEDLKFTGAVYLYFEGHLSNEERVELSNIFKNQGAHLIFRGLDSINSKTK